MEKSIALGMLCGLIFGMGSAYGQQSASTDTCHIAMADKQAGKSDTVDISVTKSAAGEIAMSVADIQTAPGKQPTSDKFDAVKPEESQSTVPMTDADIAGLNKFITQFGGQPLPFKSSDVASTSLVYGGDPRKGNDSVVFAIARLYDKDGKVLAKLGGVVVFIVPLLLPCQ